MKLLKSIAVSLVMLAPLYLPSRARADGDLQKLKHVVIIVMENHSFDNYFGALAYAPGSPYKNLRTNSAFCAANPNLCVDGLNCTRSDTSTLSGPGGLLESNSATFTCTDGNIDADNNLSVAAFHDNNYCPAPDLDHGWGPDVGHAIGGTHEELNFSNPNAAPVANSLDPSQGISPNDGFVNVNDGTEQPDASGAADDTMGFYTEQDLPYYYRLAQNFAIDDRYFCSVVGPTFPNRSFVFAATAFGHVTTGEEIPQLGGYRPLTKGAATYAGEGEGGTILDLLDAHHVSWADYFNDLPAAGSFRTPAPALNTTDNTVNHNFRPIAQFFADAAAGTLPSITFVDPLFLVGGNFATSEHPPQDIRAGEFFVAHVLNAMRQSPNWKDSVVLLTYDEHGGLYDHVPPPPAPQKPKNPLTPVDANGNAYNPDGVPPGLCADESNAPASEQLGAGAQCSGSSGSSRELAEAQCSSFTGQQPYPTSCANYNQLGVRVPFVAISPFSKPHYVSHTMGDHTSMLALIEKRFLTENGITPHLTLRDANANTLEDLFNFDCAQNHSCNNNLPPVTLAPPPSPLDGNGSCLNPPSSPVSLPVTPPSPFPVSMP